MDGTVTVSPELLKRIGMGRREFLLLRACLLDGEAGQRAFAALLPELGTADRQDWASFKQLPLLHHNLGRLGIADPWQGRMGAVRHFFWARTAQRLGAAELAIARLNAAGVPVMVLKGAALIAAGLVEPALRPMDDVDVLVPVGQVGAALRALAQDDWAAKVPAEQAVLAHAMATDDYAGRCLALTRPMLNAGTIEFDLHQYVSHFDLRAGTDDGMWRRASEGRLGRASVRIPCVEDQLLLVCTHAASKTAEAEDSAPILRWVADVACILRSDGAAIDWDLLIGEARRRQVAVMLHDSFSLVNALLGPIVPDTVIRRLWQVRRWFEPGCARALRVPEQRRSLPERMCIKLDRFRRMQPDMFDTQTPRLLASAARTYLRKLARQTG